MNEHSFKKELDTTISTNIELEEKIKNINNKIKLLKKESNYQIKEYSYYNKQTEKILNSTSWKCMRSIKNIFTFGKENRGLR